MALSSGEIDIVNQALGKIGTKRITVDNRALSPEGIQSNLCYVQVRDSLMRSFEWPFAKTRISLVSSWVTLTVYTTDQYVWVSSVLYKCAITHTSGTWATDLAAGKWTTITTRPAFEWSYQYSFPADCLRFIKAYEFDTCDYEIEGTSILTDETSVDLLYVKKITDTTSFDVLFTEVLILSLSLRLILPIAGTSTAQLRSDLKDELKQVMAKVRTVCLQEVNTSGRSDWNLARYS